MRLPRASGVLLHPTSLPGPHGSGDFGADARHFVDWLVAAGQTLWQVLPLGGIGAGNSPYMSSSAFAGNVLLIDLTELASRGWLDASELATPAGAEAQRVDFATVTAWRMERLGRAAQRFGQAGSSEDRRALDAFCTEQRDWLDDYALFMALTDSFGWREWCDWPRGLGHHDAAALEAARIEHAERIAFWKFAQWCFFGQWAALKKYANERGVRIIGDAPIFVAYQSADVWSRQELFELDASGRPTVVAGVPPDLFSATGQRWGNPLYRWIEHAADGYAWWVDRIRRTFELVDIVRIDHFRGFAGHWEIPADEPTAVHGRWVPGPGAALFNAIAKSLGPMPIIAEDLGVITPDVDALRKMFALPGMRILHFAFAGDATNRYLPHNHEHDSVVYTGSHDNDTTLGWWASASEQERDYARQYFATDGHDMPWTLIRAAMASVADTAIHPLQDILGLGSEARMNRPSKDDGCWEWRFDWRQVQPWHGQRLADMGRLYGRDGRLAKT